MNIDMAKAVVESEESGVMWVGKAIPVLVSIASSIKVLDAQKKSEMEPYKPIITSINDMYDPQIKALKDVDGKLRDRVSKEYDGTDPIKVEGSGTLIIVNKGWTYDVVDAKVIPKKYLKVVVDDELLMKDIEGGVRSVKGINIKQKKVYQIRAEKADK